MTNAEIFIKAHQVAKSTRQLFISYREAFRQALIMVHAEAKAQKAVKEPVKVRSVFVHWSENSRFKDNSHYSLTDFERIASYESSLIGENEGYDKTKLTVYFDDGDTYELRLDLCPSTPNLTTHVRKMRMWREEQGKDQEVEAYTEILEAFAISE